MKTWNGKLMGLMISGCGILAIVALIVRLPFVPPADTRQIAVEHAWAKGTASIGQTLPIFLTIRNGSPDGDRLVGVRSPAASSAIVKKLERDGAFLRATPIAVVEVQSGQRLNLRQAEYQISLLAMIRSVRPGDQIPVILQFERAGEIEVKVVVENIGEPDHAEHLS